MSETEQKQPRMISINRALRTKKDLIDKINGLGEMNLSLSMVYAKKDEQFQTISDSDLSDTIKSANDQIDNLFKTVIKIDLAIKKANETTTVYSEFLGGQVTLQNLLSIKQNIDLLKKVNRVYTVAQNAHERKLEALSSAAESAEQTYLNNSGDGTNHAVVESIRNQHQPVIVDPLGIVTLAGKKREDLEKFVSSIDMDLNDANSREIVEITW